MEKGKNLLYWAARLIAAVIMVQTLYYKFTASEESVYIFTTVGMEPWGRIGVGVLELIASVLILLNATAWLGAALALGLMAGAIVMHTTLLGIEIKGDGGQLFIYAIIVALASVVILVFNKHNITELLKKILKKA